MEAGRRIDVLKRDAPSHAHFYVTDFAILELHSVFAVFVREGHLDVPGWQLLSRRIAADLSSRGWLHLWRIRRRFVEPCCRLLEEHGVRRRLGLKAADSLHLLAALDMKGRDPNTRLVTADQILARVAQSADLVVELLPGV